MVPKAPVFREADEDFFAFQIAGSMDPSGKRKQLPPLPSSAGR
jgi:hypothetical protein